MARRTKWRINVYMRTEPDEATYSAFADDYTVDFDMPGVALVWWKDYETGKDTALYIPLDRLENIEIGKVR